MTKTKKNPTYSMPALAPGGQAAWDRNLETHNVIDGRCADCDCREGARAITWPCGTKEPRIVQDVRLAFKRSDTL